MSVTLPAPAPVVAPAAAPPRHRTMTREERKVILASSIGTVFEWYDFYLYGSLATIIGAKFFSQFDPSVRDIFALLAFAAGFLVRPFGALLFGRLGDTAGRKHTFLITILMMGVSTFVVGLLPTSDSIGISAAVILIAMRLLQGLALGGEYGGAATYVAEHAPQGRRGFYTSWIQTTATLGLFLSLLVILVTRTVVGEAAFADWGWRVPFLVSILLLGVSVWIRLQLRESPAFQSMKRQGTLSGAPLTDSVRHGPEPQGGRAGAVRPDDGPGRGLVHRAVLRPVLPAEHPEGGRLHLQPADRLRAAAGHAGLPVLRLAVGQGGAQADHPGRLRAGGDDLLPGVQQADAARQPRAVRRAAVHPGRHHRGPGGLPLPVQPHGDQGLHQLVRHRGAGAGVPVHPLHAGRRAAGHGREHTRRGRGAVQSFNAAQAGARAPAMRAQLNRFVAAALQSAGYPPTSNASVIKMYGAFDLGRPRTLAVIGLLTLLVAYVTMVYGPIAAALVELFPSRIRYSAMSLPYHIGNGWFGGLLPATTFAIIAATGDIYSGLWYPVAFATVTVVVGALFIPETKARDIYAEDDF